jgi:pantoate--beta-alanine ligase
MLLFKKTTDLENYLNSLRRVKKIIGFVPTMGALHDGHLELVRAAKTAQCDFVVASIFVNPTQFNDPKDLEKYPRTPGNDLKLLMSVDCDALFMPDEVAEIYPQGRDLTVHLDFGVLETVMEGHFRPGHFEGMATVVNRLLEIIGRCKLFMGQKDYQQLSVVRNMIGQLNIPAELNMVETRRESDGLAMSSRNVRLTPEMRAAAPIIFNILAKIKAEIHQKSFDLLKKEGMDALTEVGFRPEYVELSDGISLQQVAKITDSKFIVCCIATWAGDVRLIDNMVMIK